MLIWSYDHPQPKTPMRLSDPADGHMIRWTNDPTDEHPWTYDHMDKVIPRRACLWGMYRMQDMTKNRPYCAYVFYCVFRWGSTAPERAEGSLL